MGRGEGGGARASVSARATTAHATRQATEGDALFPPSSDWSSANVRIELVWPVLKTCTQ